MLIDPANLYIHRWGGTFRHLTGEPRAYTVAELWVMVPLLLVVLAVRQWWRGRR